MVAFCQSALLKKDDDDDALYGAEKWTMAKTDTERLEPLEMWAWPSVD